MLDRMAARLLEIAPLLLGASGLLAVVLGVVQLVVAGAASPYFVGLGLTFFGFGALIEALRRLARAVESRSGAPGTGEA